MDAEPVTGLLLGRLPGKGLEVSATCCSLPLYVSLSIPLPSSVSLSLLLCLSLSRSLASCALLELYVCVTGVGLTFFSNKSKRFLCKNHTSWVVEKTT